MINTIYIKLILAAFFWASSAIAGKLMLEIFHPSQVTFLRFGVATLILVIFVLLEKKRTTISLREHLKLAILGIVGVSLCYYFYFEGLNLSSALNAGLIEATIPLITLAISIGIKEEKFNVKNSVGFALAYLGVIIVVTNLDFSVIANSNYNMGDLLLLISTVCFGIYNILVKKLDFSFVSQKVKLLYIFMYGSIALLPWVYFDSLHVELHWDFSLYSIALILVLSLGASVLAYIFFNEGIKELGASRASSFINLVPILTIILAIAILKESLSLAQAIGSVAILLGVYISQKNLKLTNPVF